jgi:bifunctional UDP-N-acetylglucosamine pyrophosphorylase/glucosamine-1-phosphate N-acetyltransferase
VQRAICDVNAGIYRVDAGFLFETLTTIRSDNAQGEFYLNDNVQAAADQGRCVKAIMLTVADAAEANGVNDRVDLAEAEARMQQQLRLKWMRAGVTLRDPSSTYLDDRVEIGPDSTIEPGVALRGETRIGINCTIGMGSQLINAEVGRNTWVRAHCHFEGAKVAEHCIIGPFARLRPGTVLHEKVKVGNFVETKKTVMHAGAKASHLTYLGDATVGAKANVGAGTITCNYDGENKHRTVIGAGAFIGSNSALVAPVTIADGAYVGGGSAITDDVPEGALAVGRARQKNIEGWVERRERAKEQ